MFKPTKFVESNYFVPSYLTENGEKKEIIYHYYQDPKNTLKVSCVEISDQDLEEIKRTRRIYIIMQVDKFLPFTLQAKPPFEKPKVSAGKRLQDNERTLRINGKKEDKD